MSTETHEIIIKARKDQLADAAAEYKRKVQEMTDASKRMTAEQIAQNKLIVEQERQKTIQITESSRVAATQQLNISKVSTSEQINASKVATAQELANIKLETKATLDAMAEQKKARLDAAKQTMTQQRDQFGLSGDMSQITSFRELTLAIKNAKSGVLEFGAATKMVGSDKTYGQWLNELTDKKQVLRRAAGQTSEQMLAMSRDFSVVALTARNLIVDIGALTKGDKSFPELAAGIAGVGTQALIITPALLSVGKTFQAMGGSALLLGGSILPTLLTGITAVAAAFGVMYSAISSLPESIDRIGKVLSGSMSYWDAFKEQLRDNTFGIVDYTDAVKETADPMLTMVRNMNYLTSAAHYSSDAFKDLKTDVENAVNVIQSKFAQWVAFKHSIGEPVGDEKMGPPVPPKKERTSGSRISSGFKETVETVKDLNAQLAKSIDLTIDLMRASSNLNTFKFFAPLGAPEVSDITKMTFKPQTQEEINKLAEEKRQAELEADQQALAYAQEFVGLFGTLPGIAEDIKNIFFNILQGVLSGGSGGGILGFLGNALITAFTGGMPSANFNPLNRPGDMLPPVMGLPSGHSGSGGALLLRLDMGEMGIYNFMKKGNELIQVRT